jgi:hypothetical protein
VPFFLEAVETFPDVSPGRIGETGLFSPDLFPFPHSRLDTGMESGTTLQILYSTKEGIMKLTAAVIAAAVLSSSVAMAAMPKSYQVTGPVLEVKGDMVTIQKGKEKWEIARDKDTKVTGDLKVGSKATIYYQMKATSIEAKGAEKKK